MFGPGVGSTPLSPRTTDKSTPLGCGNNTLHSPWQYNGPPLGLLPGSLG